MIELNTQEQIVKEIRSRLDSYLATLHSLDGLDIKYTENNSQYVKLLYQDIRKNKFYDMAIEIITACLDRRTVVLGSYIWEYNFELVKWLIRSKKYEIDWQQQNEQRKRDYDSRYYNPGFVSYNDWIQLIVLFCPTPMRYLKSWDKSSVFNVLDRLEKYELIEQNMGWFSNLYFSDLDHIKTKQILIAAGYNVIGLCREERRVANKKLRDNFDSTHNDLMNNWNPDKSLLAKSYYTKISNKIFDEKTSSELEKQKYLNQIREFAIADLEIKNDVVWGINELRKQILRYLLVQSEYKDLEVIKAHQKYTSDWNNSIISALLEQIQELKNDRT